MIRPEQSLPDMVLLISSGHQAYREYILQQLHTTGRVWLVQNTPPTWESPYLTGSTQSELANVDAVIDALQPVLEQFGITGIICWDEWRIEFAAELAAKLALPFSTPKAIRTCRDKHATRQALAAYQLPQPVSVEVSSLAQAQVVAEQLGYPVVIKPRGLGASMGISRVANADHLEQAFEQAAGAFEQGALNFGTSVLVEECVVGEEISVDSAVFNGNTKVLFVARKHLGFQPHCEEVGHSVSAHDPLLTDDEFLTLIARIHEAVHFTQGMTHIEIMLTDTGPKIIEVNGRIGGDVIPLCGYLATGIAIGEVAYQVAVGQTPTVVASKNNVSAVQFFYPPDDVVVQRIQLRPEYFTEAMQRLEVLARPGDTLRLPPKGHVTSRYAYVICNGATHQQAHAACLQAEAALALQGQPVGCCSPKLAACC